MKFDAHALLRGLHSVFVLHGFLRPQKANQSIVPRFLYYIKLKIRRGAKEKNYNYEKVFFIINFNSFYHFSF